MLGVFKLRHENAMINAIKITNVYKSFGFKKTVLKNINLSIDKGEMVALIGASGSGKSTLIRTISGLITIDKSSDNKDKSISILGTDIQKNGRVLKSANHLRSRTGVVFQQFNLVPRLSVLVNVLLGNLGQIPRWRGSLGWFTHEEKQKAMLALERVGIAPQALQRGSTLSGGQQQRAAIARTLVQGAEIIIADEPIASLDPNSARRVMEILSRLNQEDGITILVSLHQVEYAMRYCPRTVALRDGEVVYDGPSENLTPDFLNELYGAESKELFLPGFNKTSQQDVEASDTQDTRLKQSELQPLEVPA